MAAWVPAAGDISSTDRSFKLVSACELLRACAGRRIGVGLDRTAPLIPTPRISFANVLGSWRRRCLELNGSGTEFLSTRRRLSSPVPPRRSLPPRAGGAKAELEAEAKAAAEAKLKAAAEAQQQREAEGRKKSGRPAAPPSTTPDPKAQKNFTDPESRIMKSKDGLLL
jgi:hypothetical protein